MSFPRRREPRFPRLSEQPTTDYCFIHHGGHRGETQRIDDGGRTDYCFLNHEWHERHEYSCDWCNSLWQKVFRAADTSLRARSASLRACPEHRRRGRLFGRNRNHFSRKKRKNRKREKVKTACFLVFFASPFVFCGSTLLASFGLSCQKNKMLRLCSAALSFPRRACPRPDRGREAAICRFPQIQFGTGNHHSQAVPIRKKYLTPSRSPSIECCLLPQVHPDMVQMK